MKYVILQADGMPDHPLPELGNKTPLEVANTPNLDNIAKRAVQFDKRRGSSLLLIYSFIWFSNSQNYF